jgi:exodeoxyribonuclease-5
MVDNVHAATGNGGAASEPSIEWSADQRAALGRVGDWYHNGARQTFLLEGAAGSGKTTLLKHIGRLLGGVYAAFTGKASAIMRRKGCDGADTIHSLIYRPILTYTCARTEAGKRTPCGYPPCQARCPHVRVHAEGYELNPESKIVDADLAVIDEVSMVNSELGRDLLSFGKKVLVSGDRNQLPPIEGGGYFTDRAPDFALTQIHRQEAGSPIIHLATKARLKVPLSLGQYGDSYVIARDRDAPDVQIDQVICGRHTQRCHLNRVIRAGHGFSGETPQAGEKIICLKNCRPLRLLNGTMWRIVSVLADGRGFYDMTIQSEDDLRIIDVVSPIATFGLANGDGSTYPHNPFDWGYAITCHKSQGSQWDNVCVFDESMFWKRRGEDQSHQWLYTAITRAAKSVVVVM